MIIWQPLSEARREEAMLLAHGLVERSLQEWFYGQEMPEPGSEESLRLINGAWVLVR